jgi:hypothetical protein
MNRPLSPRDRGYQGRAPRREFGHRGIVPGFGRLVGRVAATPGSMTVGPCCATVGTGSTLWGGVGSWTKVQPPGLANAQGRAFEVDKHGGFERSLLETLCAIAKSRVGRERLCS